MNGTAGEDLGNTAGEDPGNESHVAVVADVSGAPDTGDASELQEKSVSDALAELRELFDSKIRYDEVKERQIEALHEELQGYRQGLYQQIMQPVMMDLIGLYDEMAGELARISGGPDGGLAFMAETVEEVLARYGVTRYEVDGDAVDRSRQKVIGAQDTTDPELGKRVARRVRPGFEMKGKVIRPEWVTAYRYVPDADTRQPADE
jgi:molecular chaperone GrpE